MKSLIGLAIILVIFSQHTQGFKVYCKSEYYRKQVDKSGCDTKYVGVYACLGTCGSFILPLSNPPYFSKFCQCCKATGTEWKKHIVAEMLKRSLLVLFMTLCFTSLGAARNPLQEAYANIKCVLTGYTHTVQVHNCQPHSVKINICQGTCMSASTPTGGNYEQVSMCTCCRQTQTKTISVGLWCQKNPSSKMHRYFHPIESATECSCTLC
ncbi:hypothetical protein AC249_AIPGENE20838 [Exaiptasia diaphana]|nr:hypothetical protein AC249_AIPGENE20838 [Exaiptasia diaphana]